MTKEKIMLSLREKKRTTKLVGRQQGAPNQRDNMDIQGKKQGDNVNQVKPHIIKPERAVQSRNCSMIKK